MVLVLVLVLVLVMVLLQDEARREGQSIKVVAEVCESGVVGIGRIGGFGEEKGQGTKNRSNGAKCLPMDHTDDDIFEQLSFSIDISPTVTTPLPKL